MHNQLVVYNTLSQKKEVFVPIRPGHVAFYVCGVTVYDHCHIGHARVYVVFDCMRRYLEWLGYTVTFVQNFTDIDDKIIQRAQEKQISTETLTDGFIQSFFEDMDRLYIKRASLYPKATDYIPSMVKMIERLIDQGSAYVSNGDVYFSVGTFKPYGTLSKKILQDLVSGSRVEVSDKKRNPLDFALWKASRPGEPQWESPWGMGRPGWHIECSAMILDTLGPTIDIHGGGEDLIFPHHENEICQSESFTGKPFSTYWMHNGFVTIRDKKMSKSLQNVWNLKEGLSLFDGETIRFFLLKTQYRSPLSFSEEGMREAKTALEKLRDTLKRYPIELDQEPPSPAMGDLQKQYHLAIQDDFNFAQAIGYLFEMSTVIHKTGQGSQLLYNCGKIMGLFNAKNGQDGSLDPLVESLISQRQLAKENKDYAKADLLRNQLLQDYGIVLEDTKDGLRWRCV